MNMLTNYWYNITVNKLGLEFINHYPTKNVFLGWYKNSSRNDRKIEHNKTANTVF